LPKTKKGIIVREHFDLIPFRRNPAEEDAIPVEKGTRIRRTITPPEDFLATARGKNKTLTLNS
jgi:hypothetical protein